MLDVRFGEDNDYSDKISYVLKQVEGNVETSEKFKYNADLLKEILYCNKEMNEGKFYLSLQGLMKIEFEKEGIKSCYWLVKN
jgi:hypothetical protein